MNLIDFTYFEKRLLRIPNLNDASLDQLTDYIETSQSKFLDIMLGVKLKNQFLTGLEAGTIDQIWLDLRDGKTYEVSGIEYEWKGFVNDTKESPLANYTFCNLTTDNQFLNTGIGEVRSTAENSVIITPQYRISNAWNEMVEMNKALYHFLLEFEDVYQDWEMNHKKAKSLMNYDFNIGL